MNALSMEVFYRVNSKGTAHEMWELIKHLYGDSSAWDDGKFKEEDHIEIEHEDVEHIHNTVIMEYCSTSWSSDDDDRSTTSSLDKVDDGSSSDGNDDSISNTLDDDDDDDCSCPDDIATTSPSTTPHCFMSLGDTNVVGHSYSYDELVDRLASMNIALENEMAKQLNWKMKTHF
jgi:hypothetical protein